MQIKANVLHRPVFRSPLADTGTLGGAVLGSVVLKDHASLLEASRAMLPPGEEFDPDEEAAKIYDERFEHYKELYAKLRDINRVL